MRYKQILYATKQKTPVIRLKRDGTKLCTGYMDDGRPLQFCAATGWGLALSFQRCGTSCISVILSMYLVGKCKSISDCNLKIAYPVEYDMTLSKTGQDMNTYWPR